MSKFYKELKELRESRKISLDEISERTKINVQYLQDIEKGSFEDIETPYLRLFLRAFSISFKTSLATAVFPCVLVASES